jgi:hypothetical protein
MTTKTKSTPRGAKSTIFFSSDVRLTFTGESPVDSNGNKEIVEVLSKTVIALIQAFKTSYPNVTITPTQETTYSQQPLNVEKETKQL